MESVPPVASHLPSGECHGQHFVLGVLDFRNRAGLQIEQCDRAGPSRDACRHRQLSPILAKGHGTDLAGEPARLAQQLSGSGVPQKHFFYPPETSVLLSGEKASAVTGTLGSAAKSARQRKNKESAGFT